MYFTKSFFVQLSFSEMCYRIKSLILSDTKSDLKWYSNWYHFINISNYILLLMSELTTLVIKKSTRQALKHLARKDQTYDQLLNELMKKEDQED